MAFSTYFFLFALVHFEAISTLPDYYHHRLRRQLNSLKYNVPSYQRRLIGGKTPSGSIVGTYYYGVGSDPNYGSFIRPQNSANGGGFQAISYNPDASAYQNLINPNYQQQQQNYVSNNNNVWQRPNTNNYYNQPYNRYPAGSSGWYANGGNYWYNHGQLINIHTSVLIINFLILIICT